MAKAFGYQDLPDPRYPYPVHDFAKRLLKAAEVGEIDPRLLAEGRYLRDTGTLPRDVSQPW